VSTTRALRFTAFGALLVIIVSARGMAMPAIILMLAAGVLVPLGLALADPPPIARFIVPLGALGGVATWLVPTGSALAIAGAGMHAGVCLSVGAFAVWRARPVMHRLLTAWRAKSLRRSAQAVEAGDRPPVVDFGGAVKSELAAIASIVGLLFLPAAAVWLLASRAGTPLAGFQEPVVTFTAAHFHVAGFAAPTILGAVGDRIAPTRLYPIATIAVCAGVPMTAIGIATNHTIEQCSAVLVASGMLVASVVLVLHAARQTPALAAKLLFAVSGLTLLLTMTLAATFALTSSAGRGSSLHGAVEIQTMIDFHGAANAMGFAFAALLALNLTSRPTLADR
jgi:hypothetical protein